jgi:hypothetical protein
MGTYVQGMHMPSRETAQGPDPEVIDINAAFVKLTTQFNKKLITAREYREAVATLVKDHQPKDKGKHIIGFIVGRER